MAKVYEALRRAEEERRRRAGGPADVASAPLEWEAPGSAGASARLPWWRRLLPRAGRPAPETAADLNKRRIVLLQPDSFVAEQYRTLRGRIDAIAAQHPIKTLAVTSALPGEGKTTAAINLAMVTALSLGRRVLLVDCDMRRPQVHRSLGLNPEAGLAEVLTDRVGLDLAVTKVEGANLEVLGVRGRPENPSELLSSERMSELVAELARRYDRVILDTPAALGLPDAKAVSDLCDGHVLVVRANSTSHYDVTTILEILDRKRLLGLVLNGAEADRGRYGYYAG